METPEEEVYRSMETSHFNSCMEYGNEKEEQVNNGITKS
jgi:hypothetical protein